MASEVKLLAAQTSKATEEIGEQVATIQSSTQAAVTAIRAIMGRLTEISNVTNSISAAVDEQGAATQEIVRNVSQAAAGTRDVTVNIAGVAGAAEHAGTAANRVLASAAELTRQSDHLSREVQSFIEAARAA